MSTATANGVHQTLLDDAPGLSPEECRIVDTLVSNMVENDGRLFARMISLGTDRRRSIAAECGWPKEGEDLTPEQYHDLVEHFSLAGRVNEMFPKESWRVDPEVYEDEDGDESTDFEEDWYDFGRGLGSATGPGYFEPEDYTHPVWEYFLRADIESGKGRYGGLFLGLDDGEDFSKPVRGWKETGSIGVGLNREKEPQGDYGYFRDLIVTNSTPPNYTLTTNAEATRAAGKRTRKCPYLRVLNERDAPVSRWEMNRNSPRFGQPVMYSVTFGDPWGVSWSGISGMPSQTREVHWSRVVHFADVWETSSAIDWIASPRCKSVRDELLDGRKIGGASAEGFWLACITILTAETHPALGGDVKVDDAKMKLMFERLRNGMQRELIGKGFSFKTLAPAVTDPTPHMDRVIKNICVRKETPARQFEGSERGELATSEDVDTRNERVRGRQMRYCTPRMIVPFVNRLIDVGVLRPPETGFKCHWPEIVAQSEQEIADVGKTRVETVGTALEKGVLTIIPEYELLTVFCGLDDGVATAILDAAKKRAEADGTDVGGSALTETVGGITALMEMYKTAVAGGITPEQFKAILVRFYALSDAQADELVGEEGFTATVEEAGMGAEAEVEAEQMKIDAGVVVDPKEQAEMDAEVAKKGLEIKEKAAAAKPAGNPFGGK